MSVLKVNPCLKPLYFYGFSHTYWYIKYGTAHCVLTARQNLGKFLEDLELDFKLFCVDSGSAYMYIVLESSRRCLSGMIEYFDTSKMASKMEANYKVKNIV